jgi:hypothetical protein
MTTLCEGTKKELAELVCVLDQKKKIIKMRMITKTS